MGVERCAEGVISAEEAAEANVEVLPLRVLARLRAGVASAVGGSGTDSTRSVAAEKWLRRYDWSSVGSVGTSEKATGHNEWRDSWSSAIVPEPTA